MNFKWNYEPPTLDQQKAAKELAEKIGMSPILAQLLIQRGIKTESAAKRFFRPMLNELIDPFLMNDMVPRLQAGRHCHCHLRSVYGQGR